MGWEKTLIQQVKKGEYFDFHHSSAEREAGAELNMKFSKTLYFQKVIFFSNNEKCNPVPKRNKMGAKCFFVGTFRKC